MMNPICILLFTAFVLFASGVHIEENGYKGITISFSEKVLQKPFDFEKLKNVLRNASELLFTATRKRSYFKEFIFIVPPTWTDSACDNDATDVPRSIDIYVTDSTDLSTLRSQHSKGCGQKGDIIYMPRDWLAGSANDLAFQFVQHWSTFRYGVFSEDPERLGSCFATSDSSWAPSGCYNVELDEKASFDENGLPVCLFPDDFKEKDDLRSSIMFSSNSSKVVNFCDGTESLPHNPVAPTLHNRICKGYSVWSVIKDTEDFQYSRNLPVQNIKPPEFRCFKESKTHMTLIVQDTDTEMRTEIRYALYYFLSNIAAAADLQVSLVTFSNATLTEAANTVELDLQDEGNLKSLLVTYIKLNKRIPNICLACGLRKAYKVSAEKKQLLRVIVLFAYSSSLQNSEITELTELIRRHAAEAILYLIILEDTNGDPVPFSLVDTIQANKGRLFRVKNDRVFVFTQMNIALLDASKNILHIEDKILVVHQKTHVKVASNFLDVFRTPKNVKGKLLYSMQCKNRGDIRSIDNGCSILDQELQSPICESKSDLKGEGNSSKIWRYNFEYMAGSDGSTCVSLALLKLHSPLIDSFSVKGWFNENEITPGRNALIIYAEIIGRMDENIHVEAIISGPGLAGFRLELRDNGNGDPDIIKGDNIYSRYFTSFPQKGIYTVSIYVEASIFEQNIIEENSEMHNITAQTKVIGSFKVTESPPQEDIIPPNRVCDLNVVSVDNINKAALLQWTAPGDNYDDGKAKKYIIKVSNHWMSLLDFVFGLKENILLNTDEFVPGKSGTTENLRIQSPVFDYKRTYYIALGAEDASGNMGKISNIRQIYFKENFISRNDTKIVTTETSKTNSIQSSSAFVSTEISIKTSISPMNKTTSKDNTTITTEGTDGIFIKKKFIVIAASTLGAVIILLIIINIIICYFCLRKKNEKKPKRISRKASLRPPYNLNIAYRHGSQSSLDEDKNAVSDSMTTLADHSTAYSASNGRRTQTENKYTYHTSQSLKNKKDSPSIKNDLGFNLVQPMPAYATSSLSRFEARQRDSYDDYECSNTRFNGSQNQSLNNAQDTHIYTLGEV